MSAAFSAFTACARRSCCCGNWWFSACWSFCKRLTSLRLWASWLYWLSISKALLAALRRLASGAKSACACLATVTSFWWLSTFFSNSATVSSQLICACRRWYCCCCLICAVWCEVNFSLISASSSASNKVKPSKPNCSLFKISSSARFFSKTWVDIVA